MSWPAAITVIALLVSALAGTAVGREYDGTR